MEKIHGTSAHVKYIKTTGEKDCVSPDDKWGLKYFSGGEKHERFVNLFEGKDALYNYDKMFNELKGVGRDVVIYGEAYGGSQQGMRETYGEQLRFIAFDVKIGDWWLSVPDAESLVQACGLDFVYYEKVSTDLDELNRMRDMPSPQAVRNGITTPKNMEGVVLRPLIELTKNNGKRIISKHKRDDFRETKTKRVVSEEQLKVLSDANEVADEWVTTMRLNHVLDKIENKKIENMKEIIDVMIKDVKREGEGELIWSNAVGKAIAKKTVDLYKKTFWKLEK